MQNPTETQIKVNIMPVYSDFILATVTTNWKPNKTGKKALNKQHLIKIIFADTSTNTAVSYVVMNTTNVQSFIELLQRQLKIAEENSKTDKIPTPPKPIISDSSDQSRYFG